MSQEDGRVCPRVPQVLLQTMLTWTLGLGHLKGVAFG